jgi:2-oxo-4-hydroxy-4-carboxy-5-ureidoimidazoline decarboxylase
MSLMGRRPFLSVAAFAMAGFGLRSLAQAQGAGRPVTLDAVNRMDAKTFVASFGDVFERAPWVAEAAYAKRPFATVAALDEAMIDALRTAPAERQIAFLRSLPDIGDGNDKSRAAIQPMTGSEVERLKRLEQAYRTKFGYGYRICLPRRTPETVLAELERRLANDPAGERATALSEEGFAARLRIADLVSGPGAPKVHGDLNTHVLDAVNGRPAAGMGLELHERFGERSRVVFRGAIDAEGRGDILWDQPLPIGRYELRFGLADYFRRVGVAVGDTPFLDYVPLRFAVDDAEGHYHLPLICTPWTYSTYRGS